MRLHREVQSRLVCGGNAGANPIDTQGKVIRIDFASYAVASTPGGCDRRGTCAQKRIEHRIAYEREHPNEPLGQCHRKWRGMIPGRCPSQAPDLPEPTPRGLPRQ